MQKKQNVFMIMLYNHPILKLRFPIVVRYEVIRSKKIYENLMYVPEVIEMRKTLRSGKKKTFLRSSLFFFIVKIIGSHFYFF